MFASNRLKAVQDLCSRAIWLEHGRVAADGPAEQVIEAFMDADRPEDELIGELEGIEPGGGDPARPAHQWAADADRGPVRLGRAVVRGRMEASLYRILEMPFYGWRNSCWRPVPSAF